MFLPREMKKLALLIDNSANADNVLEENEKDAVKKTTNINRIRDQFIVPKHSRPNKTLLLVKLFTFKLNFYELISQILSSLFPVYELRIGCSFIMINAGIPSYVYAIPARPINDECRIIRGEEDEKTLLSFAKNLSATDLLKHVFNQRNTTNPFEKSGYRPEKLVCLSFWITKV